MYYSYKPLKLYVPVVNFLKVLLAFACNFEKQNGTMISKKNTRF